MKRKRHASASCAVSFSPLLTLFGVAPRLSHCHTVTLVTLVTLVTHAQLSRTNKCRFKPQTKHTRPCLFLFDFGTVLASEVQSPIMIGKQHSQSFVVKWPICVPPYIPSGLFLTPPSSTQNDLSWATSLSALRFCRWSSHLWLELVLLGALFRNHHLLSKIRKRLLIPQ